MFRKLFFMFLIVLCTQLVNFCICEPAAAPPKEVKNKLPKLGISKLRVHLNGNAITTGITVEWDSISQEELEKVDKKHPILGFKAKLWAEEARTVYHVENKDGVEEWVPTYESTVPVDKLDEIPKTVPVTVTVNQSETSVNISDVERFRPYQVRVQAFNDLGDGPYSEPFVFTILKE